MSNICITQAATGQNTHRQLKNGHAIKRNSASHLNINCYKTHC